MKHVIKRLEKGYKNYNPQNNWKRLALEEHPYAVKSTVKRTIKRKCRCGCHKRKR